jgi:Tol biopolymer transport system component
VRLDPGTRLGPYEILTPIGAGGMGEVYKARDTRLDRVVAIKILPAAAADSPDARRRFEREARTISQLSHPHICSLFDVGEHTSPASPDPQLYFVMELLDGETLADRISRGALRFEETLRYACEMAGALDAAHRQGIVHRDLKPANVMLTKGCVKLLDFGLAKAIAPAALLTADTIPVALPLTARGALAGTVMYMAPEQLEGRPADARSDVYALGAVIYEMATGKRAFDAPRRPLDLPAFELVVRTCLDADPNQRWQSAHDVVLQLAALQKGDGLAPARPSPAAAGWRLWAAAAAVIATAVAAGWVASGTRTAAPPGVARFSVAPPAGSGFYQSAENTGVSVSPDGSQLAFSASDSAAQRIWLRPIDQHEARPVAGTEGATSIFWSPDGRSLAFFAGDKLRRIDLPGGTPVTICNVRDGIGFSGTWGADDQILFSSIEGEAILRVSASGGVPATLMAPDRAASEARLNWPYFLPDGRRFLYLQRRVDGSGHLMVSGPGAHPRELMPMQSSVQYVAPGYLVFARESTLVGQRFDLGRAAIVGAPFSIADPVSYSLTTTVARFAASTRTLVYQSRVNEQSLEWFDRGGRESGAPGERGEYQKVRLSPDGRQAIFSRARGGATDVWQMDLARGTETRLTFGASSEGAGPFTPDGESLFFNADVGSPPTIFRKNLTTGAEAAVLPASGTYQEPEDVSPDGATLLYTQRGVGGNNIWQAALDRSTPPTIVVDTPFEEFGVRFSRDGRYFSYASTMSGKPEIYLSPFPASGERIRVSTAGGDMARWSRDGRELIYQSGDNRLIAVPVQTAPPLRIGVPAVLFDLPARRPWYGFDVAADGRFLAIVQQSRARDQPLSVALNWISELPK